MIAAFDRLMRKYGWPFVNCVVYLKEASLSRISSVQKIFLKEKDKGSLIAAFDRLMRKYGWPFVNCVVYLKEASLSRISSVSENFSERKG
ncbi:hypothetical protein [Peribacillus deserti]|uniref:Uncharacterized protein n=1 Tax=Peribacillus deserti TaxID=673318 RepID=A0A2N5M097_9BACI|nr:hypothetical protein [Peribacillus deserti]PLT27745.1 hypothetical protein CUU66_22295 [Peribacillus deserti]